MPGTKRLWAAALLMLGLLVSGRASAEVKVVATIQDLGWIAAQVGGPDVEVEVLCAGHRDPHVLPAKPSLARRMKKADLLVYSGLELEVGWLPLLLDAARNPRIRPGQLGELDCSQALGHDGILDIPAGQVDRSQGDIHPLGNPHFLLDPRNGAKVGLLIAERLARIDPDRADGYRARAATLSERLTDLEQEWRDAVGSLPTRKVIVYHQQWEYLAAWLDLEIIGVIENRPGISPAPRHVEGLIELGRSESPVLVMAATWDHRDGAGMVAEKVGTPLIVLPASSGAVDEASDYPALFAFICSELKAAAGVDP